MPTLQWNPADVRAYLGVEPEGDPFASGPDFLYRLPGDVLTLALWPDDALAVLNLGAGEPPLLQLTLVVRGELRLHAGFLEFRDVAVAADPGRRAVAAASAPSAGRMDVHLGLRPRPHLRTVHLP